MSEVLRYSPEDMRWRRREGVRERSARMTATARSFGEALERFREKQAVKERESVKVPWWVLVVALLGSLVSAGAESAKQQEGQVYLS